MQLRRELDTDATFFFLKGREHAVTSRPRDRRSRSQVGSGRQRPQSPFYIETSLVGKRPQSPLYMVTSLGPQSSLYIVTSPVGQRPQSPLYIVTSYDRYTRTLPLWDLHSKCSRTLPTSKLFSIECVLYGRYTRTRCYETYIANVVGNCQLVNILRH